MLQNFTWLYLKLEAGSPNCTFSVVRGRQEEEGTASSGIFFLLEDSYFVYN